MKTIIKHILVLALLFNVVVTYAQSTGLDYKLECGSVSISGETAVIFSTLSKVGTSLEWQQQAQGNTSTYFFSISSSSGDWNPNTNTGILSHTVSMEGLYGLFTLKSTATGLIVSLSLTDEDTQEQQLYTFIINTITYQ